MIPSLQFYNDGKPIYKSVFLLSALLLFILMSIIQSIKIETEITRKDMIEMLDPTSLSTLAFIVFLDVIR